MAFEWQRGTNKYSGVGAGWGGGGDSGQESYQPASIDYANAASLIGTDAADALYGAWLNGTVTAGDALTRQVEGGWGDSSGQEYFVDSQGNRYNRGQVMQSNVSDGDIANYNTYTTSFRSDNFGIRGSSTYENAQITKQLLQQYFPDATQAQLDTAAAQALSRRGSNYNEEDNPSTLVRAIGAELGGLSEQATTELAQLDPVWRERRDRIVEARNNSDDASSGVTGFLNDIGPLKYLALLAPGGAGYLGWANAISGAEQGNALKMALGAAGGIYGMDQPGLFQPGGAVEKIGGLLGNNTAALTTQQATSLLPADVPAFGSNPSWSDLLPQVDTGLGSGLAGQANTINAAAAGANYVSPWASGTITGLSSLGDMAAGSLADIAAQTGLSTLGLEAAQVIPTVTPDQYGRTGINNWEDQLNKNSFVPPVTPGLNTKDALKLAQEGLKLAAGSTDQPEGLLGASSPGRQFSMLDVNYGFQPRSYGLLKG